MSSKKSKLYAGSSSDHTEWAKGVLLCLLPLSAERRMAASLRGHLHLGVDEKLKARVVDQGSL
jgi:hypothetical protein